jgi:16S rRNA (adenine1518-N6/adenine1519-N6)-dimethyltransferase
MKKGARLGQHFLKARWAAKLVARAAGVVPGAIVLEIGPGTGNLTDELIALGGKVIAVEKDSALVEILKLRFKSELASGMLALVENDIRDVSPQSLGLDHQSYILAANIPYYITGEIIRTFLESKSPPKQMALLVQKEVAERIARSKKESILSLSVKAYGAPKYIKTVSRSCFSPAPNVDSAILAIEKISRDFFADISEEQFFKVVKAGFASRRKMLAGNLKKIAAREKIEKAFEQCGIAPKARAEDVSLEKWGRLVRQLPLS